MPPLFNTPRLLDIREISSLLYYLDPTVYLTLKSSQF